MSKEHPSSNLQMIPIDKIEVLNPRDRNGRIFDDIVGNIKSIGLKKPITVTPRKDGNGQEKFLLICGEGRLKAFKSLGETAIPAMVVDVSDEDGFIMSLAENIARRQGRTLELLAGIEKLRDQGYCCRLRKSVEIWRHRMAAEFGVERCTKLGPIGPRVLMSRLFASERRISHRRVALRDAVVAIVGMQRNFIVRPDPVAQIIKHFDHGPGLCR